MESLEVSCTLAVHEERGVGLTHTVTEEGGGGGGLDSGSKEIVSIKDLFNIEFMRISCYVKHL